MKKLLFAIMLLMSLNTFAQNLNLDNVLSVKLRNSGVISNEKAEVKGYYYFYQVDKVDKNNYNYILKLVDENLREINSVEIVKPKHVSLVEAEYNGTAFGFLFFNVKTKDIELITYNKDLKQLGSFQKVIKNRMSLYMYGQQVGGAEMGYQFLVGVQNKGFLYYGYSDESKNLYSSQFYDNNAKQIWSITPPAESKEIMAAEYAFQTEAIVGSTIVRKKSVMSKDMSYDLLVNDIQTGKEMFKVEIQDPAFNLSATKITYDAKTQNVMVFGEYFELKDKEAKSNAIGYFYLLLDKSGKVTSKKFISWGKDLSAFVKVNEKGVMEKGARIFVHDIIRNGDGDVFVIGEQYKKAASGAGIAMAALAGRNSNVSTAQLTLMNMVILQFGPNLEAKGVHIFEKDKNSYLLPEGAEFMSAKMLALYGAANGWFDYNYYQILNDGQSFLITYNNYIKEKGEKGQNVLSVVIYTPEKTFAKDKVVLNRKSSSVRYGIAKSGYIMIAEYYKKEKKLDVRLEKLNY